MKSENLSLVLVVDGGLDSPFFNKPKQTFDKVFNKYIGKNKPYIIEDGEKQATMFVRTDNLYSQSDSIVTKIHKPFNNCHRFKCEVHKDYILDFSSNVFSRFKMSTDYCNHIVPYVFDCESITTDMKYAFESGKPGPSMDNKYRDYDDLSFSSEEFYQKKAIFDNMISLGVDEYVVSSNKWKLPLSFTASTRFVNGVIVEYRKESVCIGYDTYEEYISNVNMLLDERNSIINRLYSCIVPLSDYVKNVKQQRGV